MDTDQRTIEIVLKAQDANASLKEMAAGAAVMTAQLSRMGADDPGRAALLNDLQQLNGRLGVQRTQLRAVTQSAEELAAAQADLAKENMRVVVDGQKVNATFNEMKASASQLEKELNELNQDDPRRAKMLADYKALGDRIEHVKDEMGQAAPKANLFKEALSFAGIALTAEAVVGGVIEMGKAVFEASAKFEKYEAVMTNALGDKSKAQQAMKDIQVMAANTPFSVDELTGSFIKFVNRGLNPSMAEMTKMADIAASQGKSFDQLTEAVLDAGGGEFERLKEFGIKASKSGDEVSLSFKGVNQTVKNTPEAINGAIMAFGSMQGVAGSTAAISKTLEGQWSNLGDSADQLKIKLGDGLKPAFTLILTLFGNFITWIGRFVEGAAPLKQLFTELAGQVLDFYHEIGDVLESLGLFSSKTDTVKIAVEALKIALTLLLIPFKAAFGAAKGIVDVFIDWYNKSELLRGVLGGLGAVIVSLFTTIKDNAIKILGGVGDLIVGIFTLDKDKILAGFKSAMNATADVMLKGGERAASEFMKGYEANKNNHITRTVRVKTEAQPEGSAPTGETLKSDEGAGDAAAQKKAEAAAKKAKADRDRADRERLSDLKRWVKQEGDLLDGRDQLALARQEAANTDELKRRELQRQKIVDEADKKYNALLMQEGDHTEELAAVLEERDLRLRELQAKFAEQDEQERQKKLEQKLADSVADEEVEAAALEVKRANGLLSEQEYQDQLYELTRQGLEKRLALLVAAGQGESVEARKIQAALAKGQADHIAKGKKQEEDLQKFEQKMNLGKMELLKEGLQLVEDNLDKKSAAYQLFKAARKTAELAEIGINLAAELQNNSKAASENPLNGITAGAAGATQLVVTNGLSIARAAGAAIKLAAFAKGGRTDKGELLTLDSLVNGASGGSFVGGGPVDKATIGLIGEAGPELVIPNWLYADPKQANLMGFLEAQIASRGNAFATGGSTTGASAVASPVSDDPSGQLLDVLERIARGQQEFRDEISDWQRNLEVNLDPRKAKKAIDVATQVTSGGGIR